MSLALGTRRNPSGDFQFGIRSVNADELHFVRTGSGFTPVAPFGFAYNPVITRNPFQNPYGLLLLSSIRPRIEHFFDNPATIIPGPSRDVYTFSNINVMVRYFQNHVLEYTSFRPIGRRVPDNLMSDFSSALAFLLADPYVTNETWLKSYEAVGGEHVFRFGFVINNFPMTLENGWPTEPGCQDPLLAPIEVTVSHGRIIRYRRIAHSFEVSAQTSFFTRKSSDLLSLVFPISGEAIINLMPVSGPAVQSYEEEEVCGMGES